MKIHINKNFDFLSEWLSELPLRFDVEGGKTLHDGRNVVRCFEEGGVRLVVKRFKPVNFIQQIAYTFFCRTKAEKAYRFARIFQERGFDTPAAVAYIEDYRWGLFRIGYFVSLYCENPPAFPALVPVEHYDEQLAQSLAELICRMHLKGILHGDLNFGNFLYRKMEDGRYTLTIIDTNRSRFMEHCPDDKVQAVMQVFGQTALEVCEGQQWDMEFETRMDVTVNEYIEMIRLKTSVLLAAALKIGAILGGASETDATRLYDFGIRMGLAFQLQDDYLDVYGDPAVFGKKIGGDILCNKKTYMLITALEKAEGELKAELMKWIAATGYEPAKKIAAVTDIYNKVGIAGLCKERIEAYYQDGLHLLDAVDVEASLKRNLHDFVFSLMNRNL